MKSSRPARAIFCELLAVLCLAASILASPAAGQEFYTPLSSPPPLEDPPKVTEDLSEYFEDVIFMGDSMSYMLYQWNNLYHGLGSPLFLVRGGVSINSLVKGFRKYFYKNVEMRPEEAIADCGRKKLFIMLGANDIPQFGISGTMSLWDELLENILDEAPDVEIYIQSLTPVWTPAEYAGFTNEIIDEYNVVLEEYCQENGYHFVNIAHYFKDSTNGLARIYCSDNSVHTTYEGSAVWAESIKEYIVNEEMGGAQEAESETENETTAEEETVGEAEEETSGEAESESKAKATVKSKLT